MAVRKLFTKMSAPFGVTTVKIVSIILLLLFSLPKHSSANISRLTSLGNLNLILSSYSNEFQEYFNKNSALIPTEHSDISKNITSDFVHQQENKSYTNKNINPSILEIPDNNFYKLYNQKPKLNRETKIVNVKVYYTVKKGDNLWKIASLYSTNPEKLMKLNNLKTNLILPKQKIFIGIRDKVIEIPYINEQEIRAEVFNFKNSLLKEKVTHQDLSEIIGKKIVETSLKYLGFPYKYGGETLWGMDCSAFVLRVIGFFGIDLPRTSREQFNFGKQISIEQLISGDLVFFRLNNKQAVSHVGIYIGNNKFIHASSGDKKVVISNLNKPFYKRYYKGARRVIHFLLPHLDTSSNLIP